MSPSNFNNNGIAIELRVDSTGELANGGTSDGYGVRPISKNIGD